MEDSSTPSETLSLYRGLREEGHVNVGVACRPPSSARSQTSRRFRDSNPTCRSARASTWSRPEIAYQEDETIRSNYLDAVEALFDAGSYVGIATTTTG
jgi:hypothetical protein